MFVLRFEDAERGAVHGLVETHVGAVDEAVGVLGVELRGEAGDGSSFGVAGGNVGVEIGIAGEYVAEAGEIVVEVGEVAGYESCFGMALGGALENFYHAREANDVGLVVETPFVGVHQAV